MSAHYDRKTYIISCKNTHTHKYKTHIIQKVDSWNHHSIQRTFSHPSSGYRPQCDCVICSFKQDLLYHIFFFLFFFYNNF